jgi:hypothetical protein
MGATKILTVAKSFGAYAVDPLPVVILFYQIGFAIVSLIIG